jgi:hypothetical protein
MLPSEGGKGMGASRQLDRQFGNDVGIGTPV